MNILRGNFLFVDLVTFTEKILNRKLLFLCGDATGAVLALFIFLAYFAYSVRIKDLVQYVKLIQIEHKTSQIDASEVILTLLQLFS